MGFSFTNFKSTNIPLSFGTEEGVTMNNMDEYTVDYYGQGTTIQEEDCFFTFYTLAENEWQRLYAEARKEATMFFRSSLDMEYRSEYNVKFDMRGSAFNSGLGFGRMIKPATLWNRENTSSSFWIDSGLAFMQDSESEYCMVSSQSCLATFEDGRHCSFTRYVDFRHSEICEI